MQNTRLFIADTHCKTRKYTNMTAVGLIVDSIETEPLKYEKFSRPLFDGPKKLFLVTYKGVRSNKPCLELFGAILIPSEVIQISCKQL